MSRCLQSRSSKNPLPSAVLYAARTAPCAYCTLEMCSATSFPDQLPPRRQNTKSVLFAEKLLDILVHLDSLLAKKYLSSSSSSMSLFYLRASPSVIIPRKQVPKCEVLSAMPFPRLPISLCFFPLRGFSPSENENLRKKGTSLLCLSWGMK